MPTTKEVEERVDKLWVKYLNLIKSGKIKDTTVGMISFARFVVHEIINAEDDDALNLCITCHWISDKPATAKKCKDCKFYSNYKLENDFVLMPIAIEGLWKKFLNHCGDTYMKKAGYFFEFANHVAKVQHSLDKEMQSIKSEAWDKLYQMSIDLSDKNMTNKMSLVFGIVEKDHTDDKLRRLSKLAE
jgi:hypothetical protein